MRPESSEHLFSGPVLPLIQGPRPSCLAPPRNHETGLGLGPRQQVPRAGRRALHEIFPLKNLHTAAHDLWGRQEAFLSRPYETVQG